MLAFERLLVEKTGFAYSDDISAIAISQAADAAKGIALTNKSGSVQAFKAEKHTKIFSEVDPLGRLNARAKN